MAVQLEIRPVTESAIEEALMLQACALRSLCKQHYSQKQIRAIERSQEEARRHEFKWKGELIYGGWIKGRLVAIAAISTWGGQVGGVYVHPEFARQGIGRQMVLKLEDVAVERRYSSIEAISSLTAVRLYESVGFSRVCSTKIWCGKERIPCLFMKKPLTSEISPVDKLSEAWITVCSLFVCVAVVATFM